VVHLKSKRQGKDQPVLSGTSLAGVLRHRAERIINTLEKPITIIDEIFGPDFSNDKTKEAKASRIIVHESIINDTTDLVQTRIAIDRFTGGAYHGALFQEQPIFGKGNENLKLEIELRNPHKHEIGLLLLLLKDLWTEDLPVGGTSSIGRGRLKGKESTLTLYRSQHKEIWTITPVGEDKLQISAPDRLETFVKALVDYSKKEVNDNV
jgi:CRISPR/Cas system CSM-associated protein Csm3 (group 7 of RAMP superfamily)